MNYNQCDDWSSHVCIHMKTKTKTENNIDMFNVKNSHSHSHHSYHYDTSITKHKKYLTKINAKILIINYYKVCMF